MMTEKQKYKLRKLFVNDNRIYEFTDHRTLIDYFFSTEKMRGNQIHIFTKNVIASINEPQILE